ncbi:hypothetical protein [Nesterenkonia alkaliphila]|uniref:Uncharacterized protein n=1 Tax=Nesterenkonia alkaliphila TaxID=1463631 RepID=A0A7K1UET1_9MICC|nr:hypothetical protein [Nesterenkonia alkaliphila]MVT24987.1 hypothetical protein [Nesterenkonia alkaliphila]
MNAATYATPEDHADLLRLRGLRDVEQHLDQVRGTGWFRPSRYWRA